ncbi:hypothetical protein LCGC14_2654060 [marine sediment metagenome]|uniref:Uncharacterized protein n=1 Tax=marine sediment metagenome TaxID=412755 RepID=A0A0F8ZTU4_9ZZZZ
MTAGNHPNTRTPSAIFPHYDAFKADSWREYTLQELGDAVAFFVKRAQHRTSPKKVAKDLYDAKNYAVMMLAHVEQHVMDLGISVQKLNTLFRNKELDEHAQAIEALL